MNNLKKNEEIVKILKKSLIEKNLQQEEFVGILGKKKQTVSKYFTKPSNNFKKIIKLLYILNIKVEDFFEVKND